MPNQEVPITRGKVKSGEWFMPQEVEEWKEVMALTNKVKDLFREQLVASRQRQVEICLELEEACRRINEINQANRLTGKLA